MPSPQKERQFGFTLIELLVVIAIIAILAVVVVLTLNPAELLKQSRDANRLSDMATLGGALGLYATDLSGSSSFSLGVSSTTYISVPDSSTACANLGLPAPAGGYGCAPAGTLQNINTQGWIPMNLSNISAGSPLGSLPIDPVNQTSSGYYYSYAANGTQYEVNAILESTKYRGQFTTNPVISGYPGVIGAGGGPVGSSLFNPSGLIGYWPLDDGTGTAVRDVSGNGNNAGWSSGSSSYIGGKVGPYAALFNATTTRIQRNSIPVTSFTAALWANAFTLTGAFTEPLLSSEVYASTGFRLGVGGTHYVNFWSNEDGGTLRLNSSSTLNANTWYHIVVTYDAVAGVGTMYINGLLAGVATGTVITPITGTLYIGLVGGYNSWTGPIDDVRLYSRVLSPAEVMALYNSQK